MVKNLKNCQRVICDSSKEASWCVECKSRFLTKSRITFKNHRDWPKLPNNLILGDISKQIQKPYFLYSWIFLRCVQYIKLQAERPLGFRPGRPLRWHLQPTVLHYHMILIYRYGKNIIYKWGIYLIKHIIKVIKYMIRLLVTDPLCQHLMLHYNKSWYV